MNPYIAAKKLRNAIANEISQSIQIEDEDIREFDRIQTEIERLRLDKQHIVTALANRLTEPKI